jgi:hypothetical protein
LVDVAAVVVVVADGGGNDVVVVDVVVVAAVQVKFGVPLVPFIDAFLLLFQLKYDCHTLIWIYQAREALLRGRDQHG